MIDIESLKEERRYYNIDYNLLGKGDIPETRFALGKIILDTMRSGVIYNQTKLATEKEDDLRACKPKVEKMQGAIPTLSISKLETVAGKDGAKRGRSVVDDQKRQQKAKQQKLKQAIDLEHKCVKEELEETLSCPDIAQKKQQLKKVVVKDVKKLLSFQEVSLKNVKVESEKLCEVQTSNGARSVLGKVPKVASRHETLAPSEILGVVEKVTAIRKQRMSQAPGKILSVPGKGPQLEIEREVQFPTNMVNVLSLSNVFKGDMYSTKKDDREEKQATLGDRPRNESIGAKRARKLSSIFK